MIPAHGWGGARCVAGSRLMVHGTAWAAIGPEGSVPTGEQPGPPLKVFEGRIELLTAPAFADAWRGTAQELLALLAPSIGKHCAICDDAGDCPCRCCRGRGEFECADPGCGHSHECSACDGAATKECRCFPRYAGSVVVQGTRFVAAQMQPLRGMLHTAGDAPCAMWVAVVPRRDGAPSDMERVLFVDVGAWRFGVATTGGAVPAAGRPWEDAVIL